MANRAVMENIGSVVDAMDFIVKYRDKLTATEAKAITDPIELSRVLFRRVLGQMFENFEIRKNSEAYSLRCTNEHVYNLLYLYQIMSGRIGGSLNRLDTDLKARLDALSEPIRILFGETMTAPMITYKFRDENRFFIYVNFMPGLDTFGMRAEVSAFNAYNLASRIERLQSLSEGLKTIQETDPLAQKFLSFYNRYGDRCLCNLPRDVQATEEFIDYALAHIAPGRGIYDIATMIQNERRAAARQAQSQVLRTETDTRPRTPVRNVEQVVEQVVEEASNRASTQDQRRFADALARIRRIDENNNIRPADTIVISDEPVQVAPILTPVEEVQPVPNPNQRLFEEALARVRQRDNGDRFFELVDSPLGARATPPGWMPEFSRVDDTIPLSHDLFMTDDEYIRLAHRCKIPGIELIFKSTSVDMYDDIDIGLHGLYFTVNGQEITYKIFDHGELALTTSDYAAALIYCKEHSGIPEEIKYLEEQQ